MSGGRQARRRAGRRARRSVRLIVASMLVVAAGVLMVSAAAATRGVLVVVAAVAGAVAGLVALRIAWSEVVQSRADAAAERAALARDFRDSLRAGSQAHQAFASSMVEQVRRQQTAIDVLDANVVTLRRRCADAEQRATAERGRADAADARAHLESQRAEQAQERLAAVLDEVFGTTLYDAEDDLRRKRGERSAVIDMLEWESRLQA